eukprot:CAMPEP_0174351364 /NCGR_PEP_ID=MMETSP0811_2-20130205/8721_1 /TAXON_ID=73025 ORGANISM="Eutreptiella gymnastica-like, Strain CCMP1594" /NCGR_SAMPLE_ID=MMETSP0811_2 /ASSEMBLY_ACC=CAM_ASM_000667 /LENGTH=56 /DNA_ID=CAMNT_0015480527 /DNA_START=327 /DNA_END=497 /DNA_ORIENTATION=-
MADRQINNADGTSRRLTLSDKIIPQELQKVIHSEAGRRRGPGDGGCKGTTTDIPST